MKIAYGPPAEMGVKQLAYVGNYDGIGDDADYKAVPVPKILISIGVLAAAWLVWKAMKK